MMLVRAGERERTEAMQHDTSTTKQQQKNPHAGRRDVLRRVEQAADVVVDRLVHGLALLERLDLRVHELKVLRLGRERRDALLAAALAVERVVVVEADDGRHVADERVAVGVAAFTRFFWWLLLGRRVSEYVGQWSCVGCTARSPCITHSLFCSALSPAGGLGAPPKIDVMRRMNVDLPQPVMRVCL